MATFQSGLAGKNSSAGASLEDKANQPGVQSAQQASQHAMDFQLWVEEQAATLAKMKVFASMAKSINDQQ